MRTVLRASGALGALALLLVAPAAAQQRTEVARTVGREVMNFDFRPNGAFRGRTKQLREARRAALSRGDIRALNGASTPPVSGTYRIPVVFLQYTDSVATGQMADTANFKSVLFSATPGAEALPRPYSLKTYYEQQSNGALTMEGTMHGWVSAPFTFAFVGAGCNAIRCANGLTRLGNFLVAALDSLNIPARQVDWSLYDSDNDGFVDFVTFIHPAIGAECLGSTLTNNIWAHRYFIGPGGLRGTNYVTATPWPGHPGQFIKIADYLIQGAQGGNTSCTSGQIMPMGTIAHETGHAFGIPDLYDNSNTAATSEGVGEWSLMGSGNYSRPYSPGSIDAWSRAELGWVTVDTLGTTTTRALGPVQTSDTVLYASLAGSDQFVLIENRQKLETDTAQMNPGLVRPKLPGLLVWLVDPSIIAGATSSNTVNVGPVKGLRLLQADGFRQLDSLPSTGGGNRGDVGDSYPGSANNHRLGYTSNPSMRTNEGTLAGFVIDSIFEVSANGPVTFKFVKQAPNRITTSAAALGAEFFAFGIERVAYEEILRQGEGVTVSINDTTFTDDGRTRFAFVSWSDGQPKTHTVTGDGTPDTVVANVNVAFRLNFTANGSGSIGTSGPTTNSYVNSGSPVTLTATPTGGGAFTGWSGDTTTTNASLVLPMGRPYAVTAAFTGAVAVSYDQATDAILGITPLTGPQATYLDAVGNANAVYDLGDYLAYLKANAIVPAPGVLRRISGARPLAPTKEQ